MSLREDRYYIDGVITASSPQTVTNIARSVQEDYYPRTVDPATTIQRLPEPYRSPETYRSPEYRPEYRPIPFAISPHRGQYEVLREQRERAWREHMQKLDEWWRQRMEMHRAKVETALMQAVARIRETMAGVTTEIRSAARIETPSAPRIGFEEVRTERVPLFGAPKEPVTPQVVGRVDFAKILGKERVGEPASLPVNIESVAIYRSPVLGRTTITPFEAPPQKQVSILGLAKDVDKILYETAAHTRLGSVYVTERGLTLIGEGVREGGLILGKPFGLENLRGTGKTIAGGILTGVGMAGGAVSGIVGTFSPRAWKESLTGLYSFVRAPGESIGRAVEFFRTSPKTALAHTLTGIGEFAGSAMVLGKMTPKVPVTGIYRPIITEARVGIISAEPLSASVARNIVRQSVERLGLVTPSLKREPVPAGWTAIVEAHGRLERIGWKLGKPLDFTRFIEGAQAGRGFAIGTITTYAKPLRTETIIHGQILGEGKMITGIWRKGKTEVTVFGATGLSQELPPAVVRGFEVWRGGKGLTTLTMTTPERISSAIRQVEAKGDLTIRGLVTEMSREKMTIMRGTLLGTEQKITKMKEFKLKEIELPKQLRTIETKPMEMRTQKLELVKTSQIETLTDVGRVKTLARIEKQMTNIPMPMAKPPAIKPRMEPFKPAIPGTPIITPLEIIAPKGKGESLIIPEGIVTPKGTDKPLVVPEGLIIPTKMIRPVTMSENIPMPRIMPMRMPAVTGLVTPGAKGRALQRTLTATVRPPRLLSRLERITFKEPRMRSRARGRRVRAIDIILPETLPGLGKPFKLKI